MLDKELKILIIAKKREFERFSVICLNHNICITSRSSMSGIETIKRSFTHHIDFCNEHGFDFSKKKKAANKYWDIWNSIEDEYYDTYKDSKLIIKEVSEEIMRDYEKRHQINK